MGAHRSWGGHCQLRCKVCLKKTPDHLLGSVTWFDPTHRLEVKLFRQRLSLHVSFAVIKAAGGVSLGESTGIGDSDPWRLSFCFKSSGYINTVFVCFVCYDPSGESPTQTGRRWADPQALQWGTVPAKAMSGTTHRLNSETCKNSAQEILKKASTGRH